MTSGPGTGVAAFATSADDFENALPKRFAIDSCVFMHALEFPEKHADDPRASHARYLVAAAEQQGCTVVVSTVVLAEFLFGRDDDAWPTARVFEYVAIDQQAARIMAPVYRANRHQLPKARPRNVLKWDHLVCAAAIAAGTSIVVTSDEKMRPTIEKYQLQHRTPAAWLKRQSAWVG